ncbi:hypothetical protein KL86SPO_70592 [uncultured Sporomusa sp.]|uniref:Uncharacterized protein n=1 Tax=uncultured Sporomusa sp. TaxID=307249 RepID=A0A212M1N6_9FIRM|nr:hypothetical protein KL86SPO_70592 [uncultured Sporomusa sp.]
MSKYIGVITIAKPKKTTVYEKPVLKVSRKATFKITPLAYAQFVLARDGTWHVNERFKAEFLAFMDSIGFTVIETQADYSVDNR